MGLILWNRSISDANFGAGKAWWKSLNFGVWNSLWTLAVMFEGWTTEHASITEAFENHVASIEGGYVISLCDNLVWSLTDVSQLLQRFGCWLDRSVTWTAVVFEGWTGEHAGFTAASEPPCSQWQQCIVTAATGAAAEAVSATPATTAVVSALSTADDERPAAIDDLSTTSSQSTTAATRN